MTLGDAEMKKKIILTLATLMGLALSVSAFAEWYDRGEVERARVMVEEDKHRLDVDRDRVREANEVMQRDKQKLMEDQRKFDMDRNRAREEHHDQKYRGQHPNMRTVTPAAPQVQSTH